MILIISDEQDSSTNNVIDWLVYLKVPYYRINEHYSVHIDYLITLNKAVDFKFSIKNPHFANQISINAKEIKGYWYRRGFFPLEKPIIHASNSSETKEIREEFNKYLAIENLQLVNFFHKYFSNIPHLGYYHDNFVSNKIYNLYQAQKLEILIPDFLVTSYRSELELFLKKHFYCITKGIDRNGFDIDRKIFLGNLSKLITVSDISHIPTLFNYSFLQQYIDKKADIRIFYLDGKIYSTAIFSQNDEKTKIDFRNYNDEKPNRIQPFKLPDKEEKKLKRLMKKLNYKTGSIDYVLDKSNDLYFLEINPIGQYGFISNKCNLFLDKEICNYFKSKCYV